MSDNTVQKANRYSELGVASDFDPRYGLRQDEFLNDLRGQRGIKRLREMASNDAIVGAILSAMDLMVRSTPVRIEGGTEEARDLIEYSLHNMQGSTFEMFISDALSFLPYGFSLFEIVGRPPARGSNRGWVTLKKLAPRAQWTIERFHTNDNGDVLGVYQTATTRSSYIPISKLLHFRTASKQADPAGASVLRSAYQSWYFMRRIQEIEAIAIERELNGLPLVRVPSEYLDPEADATKKAFVNEIGAIARDVKRNEQGYVILPSDTYEHADGKLTDIRLVEFELIASQGKRDIDTDRVIQRYAQDMARSALADFVLLGSNDRGSFALSKSKSDLFLKALEGYVSAITSVMNRQLVPKLLKWNGMATEDMPEIKFGRIAPIDLDQLGFYIQSLTGAGIDLTDDDTRDFIRNAAGFPPAVTLPGETLNGRPDREQQVLPNATPPEPEQAE